MVQRDDTEIDPYLSTTEVSGSRSLPGPGDSTLVPGIPGPPLAVCLLSDPWTRTRRPVLGTGETGDPSDRTLRNRTGLRGTTLTFGSGRTLPRTPDYPYPTGPGTRRSYALRGRVCPSVQGQDTWTYEALPDGTPDRCLR